MTTSRVDRDRERAAREAWQAMCDLVLDNERRREVSDAGGSELRKDQGACAGSPRRPMPMRELAALLGIDPPN